MREAIYKHLLYTHSTRIMNIIGKSSSKWVGALRASKSIHWTRYSLLFNHNLIYLSLAFSNFSSSTHTHINNTEHLISMWNSMKENLLFLHAVLLHRTITHLLPHKNPSNLISLLMNNRQKFDGKKYFVRKWISVDSNQKKLMLSSKKFQSNNWKMHFLFFAHSQN